MKLSRKERERLVRKNEIVATARKLFLKKGFTGTSMDDIAKGSEFSKRTLYAYFKSKEEIYYSVLFEAIKENAPSYMKAINSELIGIKKLRAWCKNYYLCYKKNPEYYSFISIVTKKGFRKKISSELLEVFTERSKISRDNLKKVFNIGINDGSIDRNIDPEMAVKYIFKVMPSIIGEYIDNPDLDEKVLFQEIELVLCAFKNKEVELNYRGEK